MFYFDADDRPAIQSSTIWSVGTFAVSIFASRNESLQFSNVNQCSATCVELNMDSSRLSLISIITLVVLKPVCSIEDLCGLNKNLEISRYQFKNESWENCNVCQKEKVCIRKCCGVGFHAERTFCVRNKDPDRKVQIPIYDGKKLVRKMQINDEVGLIVGYTGCNTSYALNPAAGSTNEFFIQENGSFWMPEDEYLSNDRYCVEHNKNYEIVALVCFPDDFLEVDQTEELILDKVYIGGMILSLPFLLATFIVYALLPKKTLLMKSLMFYVFNLMFAYTFLITLKFKTSENVCSLGIAYACLFFLPASFYWINVICIDTWYSFCGFRNCRFNTMENTRFYIYCGYAWTMTIIHFAIIVGINENYPPYDWYHPGIGHGQCFLRNGYPELIFLYGPISVLLTVNIVLYIITAFKLWSINRSVSNQMQAGLRDPTTDNDRQTFILYLQLVFAMGLNWAMEIVSWIMIWQGTSVPSYVWYFTDFLNASYGVFIFFIFVFKKNVWRLLMQRYRSWFGSDENVDYSMASQVPEGRNGRPAIHPDVGATRM